MANAVFKRKYFGNVLSLICGLFLIGLFIFIRFSDSEATLGGFLCGIGFGVIAVIISTFFLFFNFKAFLSIDENGQINGKFHHFGKIDCHLSDVEYVQAKPNFLTIQLKSGKNYVIGGIVNSYDVAEAMRRNISFEIKEPLHKITEKINNLISLRKKMTLYTCICTGLMFVNIFIAVYLTGGKDFGEFLKSDWFLMAFMCGLELVTVILCFSFAQRAGKSNAPIEKLQYTARRTAVETAPLPTGFYIAVYSDIDYTGRLILFGSPHESSVYYTVQLVDKDYNLVKEFESDILESTDDLPDISSFIDITDIFLQNQ